MFLLGAIFSESPPRLASVSLTFLLLHIYASIFTRPLHPFFTLFLDFPFFLSLLLVLSSIRFLTRLSFTKYSRIFSCSSLFISPLCYHLIPLLPILSPLSPSPRLSSTSLTLPSTPHHHHPSPTYISSLPVSPLPPLCLLCLPILSLSITLPLLPEST